MKRGTAHKNYN